MTTFLSVITQLRLTLSPSHGILHQDRVAHDRALADLDAAEQNAVLDGALDDAAIGDQESF